MNRTWQLSDHLKKKGGVVKQKIEGIPEFSNVFLAGRCLIVDTVGWLLQIMPNSHLPCYLQQCKIGGVTAILPP